jgi:hypothetical protein
LTGAGAEVLAIDLGAYTRINGVAVQGVLAGLEPENGVCFATDGSGEISTRKDINSSSWTSQRLRSNV